MKKIGGIFLLILTLPTFWATHILRIFIVEFAWMPNFQMSMFQMSRFPDFQIVRIPNFKIPIFPNAAGGARQTLRSNRTPSNAPMQGINYIVLSPFFLRQHFGVGKRSSINPDAGLVNISYIRTYRFLRNSQRAQHLCPVSNCRICCSSCQLSNCVMVMLCMSPLPGCLHEASLHSECLLCGQCLMMCRLRFLVCFLEWPDQLEWSGGSGICPRAMNHVSDRSSNAAAAALLAGMLLGTLSAWL